MVSGTVLMYQTMLLSYWDIHYYLQSADVSEELKNISPTIKVWEMMTETEAVLRSTQLLFMNLQASTPSSCCLTHTCLFCTVEVANSGFRFGTQHCQHQPSQPTMEWYHGIAQGVSQDQQEAP